MITEEKLQSHNLDCLPNDELAASTANEVNDGMSSNETHHGILEVFLRGGFSRYLVCL